MLKLGEKIVSARVVILILGFILLIPAAYGYIKTKVNYDILSYLPKDIETMVGQDILVDQFGTGAFSLYVVEGMEDKEVSALKSKIENVDHVSKVIWYDSFADLSVPKDMLPEKLYNAFNNDDKDATMMAIIFDDTTSADSTMDAIEEIRKISDKQCFLSGMSAVVVDTKKLSEKETPIYVLIAVILSSIILAITMDSIMIPVLFLASIGMAIAYNLGSNIFMGQVSYITKALAAVLQLGVTMDYSIFLWHSYKAQQKEYTDKKEAMAHAIAETISSVVGSSITTVAGFVALCFMSFTLGLDLGIVMAKGVVFGVIACVTILPSLILVFDKAIEKTTHKVILPEFKGVGKFIAKHYRIFLVLFVIILIPAIYGYNHTKVYYKLDSSLPDSLESVQANTELAKEFNMNSTHMILVTNDQSDKDTRNMMSDIENIDGVKFCLGLDSIIGSGIPSNFIPSEVTEALKSDEWQLILVGSEYEVASDEVNNQCTEIEKTIDSYNDKNMLVGEAPCTKDLIRITDKDFASVSAVSIGAIFLIILCVFGSISLPIVLVAVIEFAIFINMGIPCFTGTELPFIASIVIGTIQLGATVDYAILMTTKYKRNRLGGYRKFDAVATACQESVQSIVVSALSFFAATFGVGLFSDIDMISALCTLMARGALISMCAVILMLPSALMLFDKIIMFRYRKNLIDGPSADAGKDTVQA
ncbi:efflux RND transporter permease subunit [Coprococcus eutactus]|uniref:efflux RND transporter permease subunit n=1 Tax=Coprococcus eutactus TaxID=33043 RepID=UPI0005D2BE28|nr:MMPL family transporter [Coprococcus eutactus]MBT9755337.1 MMPL family transporter [Coprococcus eutactus]MCB6627742.1 MMPL family transporter [Coprococcus eutactus]MCG4790482.1 MMPL family transporter [Coprococcus eutactus]MCQ5117673.1 MMPL family transporter [Coprococcus eutactus]MCQ5131982.1 MMPL family transporter [Coprococcus eutactus]